MDHLQERPVSFRGIRCRIKYSAQVAREDVVISALVSCVPTSPDTSLMCGIVTTTIAVLSFGIHKGG